jgi:hypothetical protein
MKKAQMTSRQGPGRGVVGLVDSVIPYAPEFLMMMFEADIYISYKVKRQVRHAKSSLKKQRKQ